MCEPTPVITSPDFVSGSTSNIDPVTIQINTERNTNDFTQSDIEITNGTGSEFSGSSNSYSIEISPTLADAVVTVVIPANAYQSSDFGVLNRQSNTFSWTYANPADVVAPTLSSSNPADNATDVARDANIVLNFSESVDVETGNITIKKTSDDSTIETIDVTSGQVTGTGTSQITVNPSSNLFGGFEYYVLIDSTAFDDTSGNSYAGISSTTALSFAVVDMQDPTTNKDVVGSIDAQAKISKNYAKNSVETILGRLNHLRYNKDKANLSRNNVKLNFSSNSDLNNLTEAILIANKSKKIKTSNKWSSWSEGLISVSRIGESNSSLPFEIDSQAISIGFDKKLNEKDSIGYAIQFAQSDSEIGSSGSSIDSENLNISFYRSNPLDNNNFIEGLIGFGLIENDLIRINGSNTLTGSRNGAQLFGSMSYGKTIDKDDFEIAPTARIDLAYTELYAYTETGVDALSYSKQIIQSGLSLIGLKINNMTNFENSHLKQFANVEYGLDFSNSSDSKMNYKANPSTKYVYNQSINSNHFASLELGYEFVTNDNLNVLASYKRTQGNESEHSDQFKFQLSYISKKETEYAMTFGNSDDLSAGFDISKNVNGFDLKFNTNQSFNENSDQTANVSLSRSF